MLIWATTKNTAQKSKNRAARPHGTVFCAAEGKGGSESAACGTGGSTCQPHVWSVADGQDHRFPCFPEVRVRPPCSWETIYLSPFPLREGRLKRTRLHTRAGRPDWRRSAEGHSAHNVSGGAGTCTMNSYNSAPKQPPDARKQGKELCVHLSKEMYKRPGLQTCGKIFD